MKAAVDVKDRNEAERIRLALADETTRAFVNIMGALAALTRKQQARVLGFVRDSLEGDEGSPMP